MYSPKEFLRQTPNRITAAVGSVLTTLGLLDLSPFTDKQNLGIVGTLGVVLLLFYVDPLTSSNAKLSSLQGATLEAIDLGKQIAPVTNVHNVTVVSEPAEKPAPRKRT